MKRKVQKETTGQLGQGKQADISAEVQNDLPTRYAVVVVGASFTGFNLPEGELFSTLQETTPS